MRLVQMRPFVGHHPEGLERNNGAVINSVKAVRMSSENTNLKLLKNI
jgi:hypothetical protein